MITDDTIAAISSAVGPGARIIVRITGASCFSVAAQIGVPSETIAGSARHSTIRFAELQFPAWVYGFRGPRSYTGEDLIEFHIPGSPVLAKMLLQELFRLGARPAEPGEFTARAYFNGRMDLTAAEGVAATITAGNEQELSAARKLLAGELARRLAPAMELLADTLALVEVGIDLSEEDVSFLSAGETEHRLRRADEILEKLLTESSRFERLAHEPQVVLVGRPNAGKSTLLNALAGRERAVVSPVPGTTRDVISADVTLKRGVIRLTDVAGIDEDTQPAFDDIDRQMREHALRAVDAADVVALVRDSTDDRPPLQTRRAPALVIHTKSDLLATSGTPGESSRGTAAPGGVDCGTAAPGCDSYVEQPPSAVFDRRSKFFANRSKLSARGGSHPKAAAAQTNAHSSAETAAEIVVSALTGSGLTALRDRLDSLCFGESYANAGLALNLRHVRAVTDARESLRRALSHSDGAGPEILALEIREALDYLGSVLGRLTPDDVLGRIFSGFCIGK